MEIKEAESIIEGLLFASGDLLPLEKISEVLGIDRKTVRGIIQRMADEYDKSGRGIIIREVNNSFQFSTRKEHYDYIKKIYDQPPQIPISQAAYEVLAIVAYRQPVTKAVIDKIRGVNSDSAIAKLIERNYIRECGRLDAPGRPALYEVTEDFLKSFGLRSTSDLPELEFHEEI